MKKYIILSALFFSACSGKIATEEMSPDISYNPVSEARIRLYGQNNYDTYISTQGFRKQVGGVRAKSFKGVLTEIFTPLKSISVGIPKTKLIEQLAKSRSSIIAGLYYEEYVIPANKSYSIYTSYRNGGTGPVNTYCSVSADVYLNSGNDYEVFADIIDNKCMIKVYKIIEKNDSVTIENIPLSNKN